MWLNVFDDGNLPISKSLQISAGGYYFLTNCVVLVHGMRTPHRFSAGRKDRSDMAFNKTLFFIQKFKKARSL